MRSWTSPFPTWGLSLPRIHSWKMAPVASGWLVSPHSGWLGWGNCHCSLLSLEGSWSSSQQMLALSWHSRPGPPRFLGPRSSESTGMPTTLSALTKSQFVWE